MWDHTSREILHSRKKTTDYTKSFTNNIKIDNQEVFLLFVVTSHNIIYSFFFWGGEGGGGKMSSLTICLKIRLSYDHSYFCKAYLHGGSDDEFKKIFLYVHVRLYTYRHVI